MSEFFFFATSLRYLVHRQIYPAPVVVIARHSSLIQNLEYSSISLNYLIACHYYML